MIETLATCFCKRMLFCYLTDESVRHQRRQEKDNCLYTADFLRWLVVKNQEKS